MALIPSCSFDEKAPEQYGWEAASTCLCVTVTYSLQKPAGVRDEKSSYA